MLTIDALRQYGANTQEGLSRCMNNEAFYLRVVGMSLDDPNFEKLSSAIEKDDRKEAFEAAHALKGVLGNLALTPAYDLAAEVTELLRSSEEADYPSYLDRILEQRDTLLALRDS